MNTVTEIDWDKMEARGEHLDKLAAFYGKKRIVESDAALRVRTRHSMVGIGTRDAMFYALREVAPDLGVVLIPTIHKVPGFWTLLWHTIKRKPVPREADIVVHFYAPAGVQCDMSALIDVIKATLRVGLTWRVVINGGD